MDATGAPRSDAERRELVHRSTRGARQCGLVRRDKSGLWSARRCRRSDQGTKCALLVVGFTHLCARDAGALGFPSDPS
ncbi:hypothetical protein GOP47_0008799 [Adiantum capillus-veneris]|uniref:Uncharacterized protein n=1 Tax=Adiantum capillus-veneris TaxID=13818 RepID=A0A9D4ZII0_ADICA|nr:hypothetical protein GOP47_0008799 [Adiantum capillus-veneris]